MDNNDMADGDAHENRSDSAELNAGDLLSAEYEYIASAAFQANEDRARVSTYYIVTFGTLVAALFSLQVDNNDLGNIHRALVILFVTLSLFGLSTLLQLVRLRKAWTESIRALNQIKQYYLTQFEQIKLGDALLWGTDTIPPPFKPRSIAFLLALQVALLGGVSFGAAAYFLGLILAGLSWMLPILSGLVYTIFLIGLYRYLLQK